MIISEKLSTRYVEYPAMNRRGFLVTLSALTMAPFAWQVDSETQRQANHFFGSGFDWTLGPPVVLPANRPDGPCHAIKDPSIVYYQRRWHLFCTIRSQKRSHQIEYLSFSDFKEANSAQRHVLNLTDEYFAGPQIFYFSPHEKWYLIYQVIDNSRKPALQPAYSTTKDINDPASWTRPALLFSAQPENVKIWIDFWVICDTTTAHLFFTSLDGRMWRSETKLSDFPRLWNQPTVVLQDDIFEASHTYRLKGQQKFLTIVEAQRGSGLLDKFLAVINRETRGWRYYKAYLADGLDGTWHPLAATFREPFAGPINVKVSGPQWTDSISHGELLRAGYDEQLVLDPAGLRFLFQGVTDHARAGKKYGEIPWRLGVLEAVQQP